MIRLFRYELSKVVTKKLFWGFVLTAVIVNALALWWLNPPPDGLAHAEDRGTYAAFLDRIDYDADILLSTAIFGSDPGSFSYRNIIRTQEDFYGMRDIQVRYDVDTGLEILFDSPSTDIIIVLLILAVTLALITDEKDKRLFLLVKSTPNGHIHTIIAKLLAMAVCVAGVSLLTFATAAVFAEFTYGLGDLTRSVQSVQLLMTSTLRVSVAEFIGLHFIAKTAGMLCVAMGVMLVAVHAKHSVILLAVTALLAAGNTLLAAIPVVSGWNALRFLNFFAMIRPHRVYGGYLNLNVFGYPVRLTPVFMAFGAIVFIALSVAVCCSFVKKRGLESNLDMFKFTLPSFTRLHTSWRYFEFTKLASVNKAALILIVFAGLQVYAIRSQEEPLFGFEHYYIMHTLNALEGELTDGKEDWILSEYAKYDYARSESERLTEAFLNGEIDMADLIGELHIHGEIMESMQGFLTVYERYEYVRDTPRAQFLYDKGYARLFGLRDPNTGLDAGMRLLTVLILSLCGLFAMEYKTGMYKVLNATAFGNRETVRVKLSLSLGLTFIAFIMASLPELIYTGRFFSFNGMAMPLASVAPTDIGAFPIFLGGMPVWSYTVFMLIMRFAVFAGVMLIISALSMRVRGNAYTALLCAGLLLLPLFLHLFGFELLNPVSLLDLVSFNGVVVSPGVPGMAQALAFAGVSAGCGWYVVRRFAKA